MSSRRLWSQHANANKALWPTRGAEFNRRHSSDVSTCGDGESAEELHLASDRTSCMRACANQFRLFLHGAAYWLLWTFQSCMPTRSPWRQFDNPDKGFSGSGFELIAALKLGLDGLDLVGGNGRDDVNEGVDDGSMLGQIEG